ncbi:hypothetical protein KAU19_01000 [Candidatus Parcubacteria bacterium]|nr:hypothetical protein [Candidatus Parcubacteria bacterium]
MTTEIDSKYKFRGGARIGPWTTSWPFCTLEISQNSLIIHDEMLKKELVLLKNEVAKVEIKKYFPIIGYFVKINHTKKDYNNIAYFGVFSFGFNKLIKALEMCGWL